MHRIFARLAYAFAVVIAMALLLEAGLWASGRPDPAAFRFEQVSMSVTRDEGRYAIHSERFFTLAPGYHHAPDHLGRYATGEWPFRGRPPEPAPAGILRVGVFGDSCVYGVGVDVAASLPERLAEHLAEGGLGRDRVQVLNFGVPGYTTLQIRLLMEEVLESLSIDAVVLYPAAWNDQAPALRESDARMLASVRNPTLMDRLVGGSRLGAALGELVSGITTSQVVAAWYEGRYLVGPRVEASDLVVNLEAMQRLAAPRPMVLLAPAHPPATRLEYPRLVEDAAAVAALGLDTQSLLREVDEGLERFFLDSIHPSPSGLDLLARAAAKALAPALDPPRLSSALEIIEVSPRVISSLGDVPVNLTLEGWTRADPLPVVLIGGAPLVALRAVGEHEVSGTLMANRAGVYDVVAQTTSGVAVLPNSVTLVPPRVELVTGPPLGVRFVARPGDRAQIHFATALRDAPKWSSNGGLWLEAPQAFESFVVADKNGNATLEVPALDPAVEEVHLQALVVPRGVPDEAASGARAWTPPSTAKP